MKARRIGLTLSMIKELAKQLNLGKTITVGGIKSPDLYLRMLSDEGCIAEAEETFTQTQISIGFIFKLKSA